jgi:phosphoribosylamine--glycine ligase
VLAARGYPGAFAKNIPLQFPDSASAELHVTGAGIESRDGALFSTSGRIANVVAWGKDRDAARERAYAYLREFSAANAGAIEQLYWREDIAASL